MDVSAQSPLLMAAMHAPRVEMLVPQKLYRSTSHRTPVLYQVDSPWCVFLSLTPRFSEVT
jgi:hypothetical protein